MHKIQRVVLEIESLEVKHNVYQVKFKDLAGLSIEGSLHSNMKEQVKKKNIRKGTVCVLQNVAVYHLVRSAYLVLVKECLEKCFR